MSYVKRAISQDNKYVNIPSPATTFNVINKTSDYTILESDLSFEYGRGGGTVFTNVGATGTVEFTLPEDPAAGLGCYFAPAAAHLLKVNRSGSDLLLIAGWQYAYAQQGAPGPTMRFVYCGNAQWKGFNQGGVGVG